MLALAAPLLSSSSWAWVDVSYTRINVPCNIHRECDMTLHVYQSFVYNVYTLILGQALQIYMD